MVTNLRIIINKSQQSEFFAKLDAVLSELGCFKIKEMTSGEYWKDRSRVEITYFFEEREQPLSAWESLFEKTVGDFSTHTDGDFTSLEHFCSLTVENGIFAVLNIPNELLLN